MKVKIKKLKASPFYATLCTLNCIVELANSLKSLGQIEPIVIDSNFNIISGNKRVEAAKLLNWTEISAVMDKTATAQNLGLKIIHSNRQRVKSSVTKFNEIKFLRNYSQLNTNQSSSNPINETASEMSSKIAEELGISLNELQKLETIGLQMPGLLPEIGSTITLNHAYQLVVLENKRKNVHVVINNNIRRYKQDGTCQRSK